MSSLLALALEEASARLNTRNLGWLALGYVSYRILCRLRQPGLPRSFLKGPPPPSGKVLGKDIDVKLEDIPALVQELRASYNSGVSLPYEKRLEQLLCLKRLFTENEQAIVRAIQEDLGRPSHEALIYDYLAPVGEIEAAIHGLKRHMTPEVVPFSLLTYPSRQYIYKEPLGLVLIIGTWNFPIMLSLVPLIGAIAGGNCVCVKPCNVAPHTAILLQQLIRKYMDPNIVTVCGPAIPGDRHTSAALLAHKFDHVFFTGSPSVGTVIMKLAAENLTPCTLELGGKNPVFVDKSADLAMAAQRTVWGRMLNAGQQCIAPDYVLCHKDVLRPFLELCAKYTAQMYGTSDKEKESNVGRIVGKKQMERLIEVLNTHGGNVVAGGKYRAEARYIEPTVLHVPLSSPSMAEETFGPMLLVSEVASMDEAIRYVQANPKPLSLYIFSENKSISDRIINNTSSGGVTVNHCIFHCAHSGLPFGGIGESGTGAYHGKATLDTFVHRKPVLFKEWLPDFGALSNPSILYPPWTPAKTKAFRAFYKLAALFE